MGRPSKRTPEIEARLIEALTNGIPMAEVCREEGMPHPSTVRDWMNDDAAFSLAIARAREDGFDAIAADALRIADRNNEDFVENEYGSVTADRELVARSKLRVETRLKLLAKWDPKRYGEKLQVGGAEDLPPLQGLSDEQLRARIAEKMAALGIGNASKPD